VCVAFNKGSVAGSSGCDGFAGRFDEPVYGWRGDGSQHYRELSLVASSSLARAPSASEAIAALLLAGNAIGFAIWWRRAMS